MQPFLQHKYGSEINKRKAAESSIIEFSNNFTGVCFLLSPKCNFSSPLAVQNNRNLWLNSTSCNIKQALAACSNSVAVPDGISFKPIKLIAADITLDNLFFNKHFHQASSQHTEKLLT